LQQLIENKKFDQERLNIMLHPDLRKGPDRFVIYELASLMLAASLAQNMSLVRSLANTMNLETATVKGLNDELSRLPALGREAIARIGFDGPFAREVIQTIMPQFLIPTNPNLSPSPFTYQNLTALVNNLAYEAAQLRTSIQAGTTGLIVAYGTGMERFYGSSSISANGPTSVQPQQPHAQTNLAAAVSTQESKPSASHDAEKMFNHKSANTVPQAPVHHAGQHSNNPEPRPAEHSHNHHAESTASHVPEHHAHHAHHGHHSNPISHVEMLAQQEAASGSHHHHGHDHHGHAHGHHNSGHGGGGRHV
jgi:hypothetical protein